MNNALSLRFESGAEPIAGYRLVREIGRGGFGEVWEATDPQGQAVALKFMRQAAELPVAEKSLLQRLQEIRHPHLLPIGRRSFLQTARRREAFTQWPTTQLTARTFYSALWQQIIVPG